MIDEREPYYGVNQKKTKTKEDLEKFGMSVRSWNRFRCQYHEVKSKNVGISGEEYGYTWTSYQ